MKFFAVLALGLLLSSHAISEEKVTKSIPFNKDECVAALGAKGETTFKVMKKDFVKTKLGKLPEGNSSVLCTKSFKQELAVPVEAKCEIFCNPKK